MNIECECDFLPLVTFAILAYNQRDYIVDAINGAISQDYGPMEIIISDDGSTDGTFEIVKSFVASYTGPHILIANQTLLNKCTVGHFFDVVDIASGSLLILSAGDDISHPNRVRETVVAWQREKAAGLFSNYHLIDGDGVLLEKNFSPNIYSELAEEVFEKPGQPDIHGASSAYDLDFVKRLPRPSERFFFEDAFMTYMLYFYGKKITKIDKALVSYRTHAGSLSNGGFLRKSVNFIIDRERKSEGYSLNKHNLYLFMIKCTVDIFGSGGESSIDMVALERYMARLEAKGFWIKGGFIHRLKTLIRLRHDRSFIRWMMPRLLGVHVFSFLRFVRG